MHVASLELSKTLFELSGWVPDDFSWSSSMGSTRPVYYKFSQDIQSHLYPAYDAGYLLRKLPKTAITSISNGKKTNEVVSFYADSLLLTDRRGEPKRIEADTPEDALCKLAIELFKQGILTKEGK